MSARKPDPNYPPCLVGAGMLGHTWFVTVKRPEGGERLLAQTNDGPSAAKHFDEAGDNAVAIYTIEKRRFKRVSHTRAVIS